MYESDNVFSKQIPLKAQLIIRNEMSQMYVKRSHTYI